MTKKTKVLFPFVSRELDSKSDTIGCIHCGGNDFEIKGLSKMLFSICNKCHKSEALWVLIDMYNTLQTTKTQESQS